MLPEQPRVGRLNGAQSEMQLLISRAAVGEKGVCPVWTSPERPQRPAHVRERAVLSANNFMVSPVRAVIFFTKYPYLKITTEQRR